MNITKLIPVLANPARLTLVSKLKSGERPVGELTAAAGILQPVDELDLHPGRPTHLMDAAREANWYSTVLRKPFI